MTEEQSIKLSDTSANPAPLGLAAFALTTILLNLHNAGLYPMDTMIMAMGIFYGGIAQVIAGYMEWKKNNTFGTIAFTSYGFFWISLVSFIVFPKFGMGDGPTPASKASFLAIWGIFSLFLFVATLKLSKALRVVFFLLVVLFALLVAATITESHTLHVVAGFEGLLCGFSALYAGMAQVINEVYKRNILPL